MERVFRAIAVTICGWIYPLIPPLYEVFYDLAGARYFTDSTMNDLASNLYILVSVVMLFTFAVQLIKAIVNPDLLTDKQKGMGNVFKRSIIAMILIVGVPIAFNEIYKMQGQVLENHLIEKIVVGFNSGDTKPGDTNVGQVLAASTIVDLLYPVEGASTTSSNLPTYYNDMITKDIKNIDKVGLYINERYSPSGDEITDDDPYVFEFKPLVAIVAGALVLYFMVIFSMDMGVRLLKLALLELTAPISIMAYIYGGDDNLKRWTKEVGTTFLEVYVKIGIIAFIIFILNNIDSFGTRVQSNHPWMIKIFILIGLFTLAGKLPELIKMLFGITYTPKGGIGGRLGAMVGPVGKIAQGGWDKVKKGATTVGLTAAGAGAAVGVLGVPGAIGAATGIGLAHHGWNKGFKSLGARAGKDTGVGRGLRAAGAFLGSGNPIKGAQAAVNTFKDVESDSGKQRQFERQQADLNKLKNTSKNQLTTAANSAGTGIKFTDTTNPDGSISHKLDSSMKRADASTANYEKLVDNLNLSTQQKVALQSYNKAENKYMIANKHKESADGLEQYLNNAINAAASDYQKQKLLNFKAQMDRGTSYSLSSAAHDLSGVDHTVSNQIQNYLKDMGATVSSTVSNFSVKGDVLSAQTALDSATKLLDNTIEAASSDSTKQLIKQAKADSKALNKKNTDTI